MKNWEKKRLSDRKAQLAYWQEHRYCEMCLFEGRGRVEAVQVHEIKFRSQGGKCVPDNMISTCLADHERMHFRRAKWLYREDLYKMKEKITEKSIRICPKCGAYKYLRDCSCGWKIKGNNEN